MQNEQAALETHRTAETHFMGKNLDTSLKEKLTTNREGMNTEIILFCINFVLLLAVVFYVIRSVYVLILYIGLVVEGGDNHIAVENEASESL